jgi:hypothetical protein
MLSRGIFRFRVSRWWSAALLLAAHSLHERTVRYVFLTKESWTKRDPGMPPHIWWQKEIGVSLCIFGLGCCLSSAALTFYYAKILPGYARPELGRTMPLNVHGRVVYLTEREDADLGWLLFGGMFVGMLGGIATMAPKKSA